MTINGAIMQLVEMRENSMMPMVFKPYFDKVIETISECEEPHSQPKWIPCSERLPEIGEYVLCSQENGDVGEGKLLDYGGWRICYDQTCRGSYWVNAWMPLPEPWKEAKE